MTTAHHLRALLDRKEPLVVPAAFDMLSARIIERAGFEAVLLSGSGVAASHLGVPDLGLMSFAEVLEQARNMARCVEIPVIADVDTGFGGLLSLRRTVEEFEQAGVAGLQLEDQTMPKQCGHLGVPAVIPADEMVQKIRLVQEVRQNSDFFLIARTDALSGCGYEEAVRRGQLYAEAGADAVFIEAPRELEQVREIPQRVPAPCVAIVVEGGKSPLLDAAELAEMGYRIIFFPATAIVSATTAMLSALKELRETGSVKKLADRVVGFRTIQELVGLEKQQRFETKFQGSSEESKQATSRKSRR
jgi:2-methylisocitrate lyase-like PEP mutase family enzyme